MVVGQGIGNPDELLDILDRRHMRGAGRGIIAIQPADHGLVVQRFCGDVDGVGGVSRMDRK